MYELIQREALIDRFMRYVQIDTQSDPESNEHPTTEKQKNLSRLLAEELKSMGVAEVETDDHGYVYAKIPSNTPDMSIPSIAFCSHVDTAPDCSGTNVKPILHDAYDGQDLILPDDHSQVLRSADFPYLNSHLGKSIITASGNTLLGADDKAGVAIIMQMVQSIMEHPQIKHGPIRVVFTPDEEVGKGTDRIRLQHLDAQYGYTLDGGEAGSLEDETFSADAAILTIHGVIVHPGYAKGLLVNAIKIAGEILDELPKNEWSPETTAGRQGFVHPISVQGIAEKTTIQFLIRDFTRDGLIAHHNRLKELAEAVVARHPGARLEYVEKEQYRNMKEVLDTCPNVVEYAKEAICRSGLELKMESIRGGTDGSRLSFMGLPCPNIFTGMQNIHSKLEWVGVEDMMKATETLLHLCEIWAEKGEASNS
jgi:tripeptide aminopeptidase